MPRVIDLTLTLREGMRGFTAETACTMATHGWNAATLHLYSHAGTHMDSPMHYEAGNQTIDEIPLDECFGPAWVVPLDGIAPRTSITPDHLGGIADRLRPGDALLLRTGWSAFVHQPKYRDELPRVSVPLARWCVERGVRLLGVEPPAVADPHDRTEITEVHNILLSGGVLIVEGLANLDAISAEQVFFGALPLKWSRGDGAPCRAFAVEGISPGGWA
jgi:kynurenine formamidase